MGPDHFATRHIGRLRTSNYDISSTCNLTCEGCLYFSGAGPEIDRAVHDIDEWRAFFAAEARRGINFAYVAGAEPSLYPDRIQACQDVIPFGVIFTNGIKKIGVETSYRIHVSLWGNDKGSQLYRGASANKKAMKNYAGDPRAVFVMTLNALNLSEVQDVAKECHDHGLTLTFSFFSPTVEHERNLALNVRPQNDYFRFSSSDMDMRFDANSLAAGRDAIRLARDTYPETVKITDEFLDWVTQPESLYQLDDEGIALDCGNRLTLHHAHFDVELKRNSGKCCSPHLDCRSCRAYAMSYATYFNRRKKMLPGWETVWTFWRDHFLPI